MENELKTWYFGEKWLINHQLTDKHTPTCESIYRNVILTQSIIYVTWMNCANGGKHPFHVVHATMAV